MTTYGVDTSHHQPLGDFGRMKASGRCDFLFAKATEGVSFRDPQYAASRAGAKAAGMLFGSYHFARPGDPVAQADYYLSVAQPSAGEIPILDVEDTAIPDAGNWSAAWCSRVKQATGAPPLLYSYPNYLATHDFRPVLALDCGLWFADYSDPVNPTAPWPAYTVRQFTDRGIIPGQPGSLDCNLSELTVDQLRSFAIAAPKPAPSPALEDDDMPLLVNVKSVGVWCLDGIGYHWIAEMATVRSMQAAGCKQITISQREHQQWVKDQTALRNVLGSLKPTA